MIDTCEGLIFLCRVGKGVFVSTNYLYTYRGICASTLEPSPSDQILDHPGKWRTSRECSHPAVSLEACLSVFLIQRFLFSLRIWSLELRLWCFWFPQGNELARQFHQITNPHLHTLHRTRRIGSRQACLLKPYRPGSYPGTPCFAAVHYRILAESAHWSKTGSSAITGLAGCCQHLQRSGRWSSFGCLDSILAPTTS